MSQSNGRVAPSQFPPPVDPVKEFIGPPTDAEDERIEVGVAIVGGGQAGLACAVRLLQLLEDDLELTEKLGEVPVAVLEKGKVAGAHQLSGAVMNPSAIRELFPDDDSWPSYGEVEGEGAAVNIEDAEILVAGGRGLGKAEGFQLCEELAEALGGAVAATRAVVDAGWYPYAAQIGQTGKTVAPKLYLAAGISGAIQHKVGMQSSENIVAINKDSNAPIFEFSDLGIVGDLNKIVPKLTEAVKAKKGS